MGKYGDEGFYRLLHCRFGTSDNNYSVHMDETISGGVCLQFHMWNSNDMYLSRADVRALSEALIKFLDNLPGENEK